MRCLPWLVVVLSFKYVPGSMLATKGTVCERAWTYALVFVRLCQAAWHAYTRCTSALRRCTCLLPSAQVHRAERPDACMSAYVRACGASVEAYKGRVKPARVRSSVRPSVRPAYTPVCACRAGHGDTLCQCDGEFRITRPIENAIFDLRCAGSRLVVRACVCAPLVCGVRGRLQRGMLTLLHRCK
jgi:hypothetical protein